MLVQISATDVCLKMDIRECNYRRCHCINCYEVRSIRYWNFVHRISL